MTKTTKSRPITLHSDVDVRATILCGDAFLRLSRPFIESIPPDFAEAERYAAENIGDMSASAVNLAFAIEIYLKALLAGTGTSFPNEHSLLVLFDALAEDIRERAKTEFDAATKDQRAFRGLPGALQVEVTRPDSSRPPATLKPFPKGLRALLQRNAKNFLAWRYLFMAETKEGLPVSFEFKNMLIAARILRGFFPDDVHVEPQATTKAYV